jgi:predicted phosphodiesterase
VTTLVVSDLHLGGRDRSDVLRDQPAALDALVGALHGVRRLVLLGDLLELRHAPAREVLARARPVLQRLGAAVEEVVIVAGNHDHELVGGWLAELARTGPPQLGLEQRIEPARASWVAGQVAETLGVPSTVAYPGVWRRDDVYATHGHYLDLHTTLPTFERIAAGVSMRQLGPVPSPASPSDYEARLAPVYGWLGAAGAWAPASIGRGASGAAADAYRQLTAGRRGGARSLLLAAAFPAAVAAVNRAGLGPVRADLSGPGLRRASLAAMHAVTRHLDIRAEHVLFGHSHRTGPLPGDDRSEWGRLVNVGSWVVGGATREADAAGPYRAGGAARLGPTGPPVLEQVVWG